MKNKISVVMSGMNVLKKSIIKVQIIASVNRALSDRGKVPVPDPDSAKQIHKGSDPLQIRTPETNI